MNKMPTIDYKDMNIFGCWISIFKTNVCIKPRIRNLAYAKCRICQCSLEGNKFCFGSLDYWGVYCPNCVNQQIEENKKDLKNFISKIEEWQQWYKDNKEEFILKNTVQSI